MFHKDPYNTKATFVLPKDAKSEWWKVMLKYFDIIQEYKKGKFTHYGPDNRIFQGNVNWDIIIVRSKQYVPKTNNKNVSIFSGIFSFKLVDLMEYYKKVPEYTGIPSVLMPNNLNEAINCPDAKLFIESYFKEIDTLYALNLGTIVDRPIGRKVVGSRIIFKVKYKNGQVERYKCRFVAKGFSQVYGVDYLLTYSPVVQLTSIRLLLAICLHKNFKMFHMDVEAAYVNTPLNEEIYIELPEGHQEYSADGKPKCLRLLKSLYGLKQSGLNWNIHLSTILLECGFVQSEVDPCVYYFNKGHESIIIGCYVDDICGGASSIIFRDEIVAFISKKVNISVNDLTQLLGMEINCTPNTISFSLKHYIAKVIKDYHFENLKNQKLPLQTDFDISYDDEITAKEEKLIVSKLPYQNLIGILLWISRTVRPDVVHAVGVLSRFSHRFGNRHFNAVVGVFRYLKTTPDVLLLFDKNSKFNINGIVNFGNVFCYSDSNYAGDFTDGKSTTGFILFYVGCLIAWGTEKQEVVALSSTEAEYIALCTCCKEYMYIRQLLQSLNIKQGICSIRGDNTSSIFMAENPVSGKKTRHILVRYHYVRQMLKEKLVNIIHVPTYEQLADPFTKALPYPQFLNIMKQLLQYV